MRKICHHSYITNETTLCNTNLPPNYAALVKHGHNRSIMMIEMRSFKENTN